MKECRVKRLTKLVEGQPYVPGPKEYVISEENSFEEILFHVLSEIAGSSVERFEELEAILASCSCLELDDYLSE